MLHYPFGRSCRQHKLTQCQLYIVHVRLNVENGIIHTSILIQMIAATVDVDAAVASAGFSTGGCSLVS